MDQQTESLSIAVVGSPDFLRRMTAALRREDHQATRSPYSILTATSAEARAVVLAERPHILVADIGLHTSPRDLIWLRGFLEQVRDRLESSIYIILAITASEKFALGGQLLFRDEASLEPSLLIDNMLVTRPTGVVSAPSVEEQLIDCFSYAADEMLRRRAGGLALPSLWADGWVPVMCDPESRNVWMRWLPRYARYVNENPLIVGPTGSGKTRLAAAIHMLSGRDGPFVSITPRDFSSTELVQAELFGAVQGAYTGAVEKWGLVRKAERGTLFIDELQSIDHDLQGKLITFIENKTYRRVGEADSHQADVRFVFATNRPLQELVKDGRLRDDFAYRLERLQIALPALHHRRLDISAALCFSLAKVLRERMSVIRENPAQLLHSTMNQIEGLTPTAYRMLFSASWPGNLRQLENTVAKLIELADIKHLRLIDNECTGSTISALLGRSDTTSSDVYERAAIDIALSASTRGFASMSECMYSLAENARTLALEFCGGDIEKAAALINDSEQAMNLFVSCRGGE